MANTPAKDASGKFTKGTGTTKGKSIDTGDTDKSDNALAKLQGTKPIPPSEIGKSPQEKRGSVNSYVDYPPVPDPEEQGIAPEAQGADSLAGSSQAAYNAAYEDGAGIYAPKPRSKN